jgi:hypothetical protein
MGYRYPITRRKKTCALWLSAVVFCLGWPKRSIQITSAFRKNPEHHSKALGEKRPNPGYFWFNAVGGSFSATQEVGKFGVRIEKKRCTRSPYTFIYIRHESGV